jgi:PIN domain nuclease of toxin-antitoxin system
MECLEKVILLDTHVAVWLMREEAALGKKARASYLTALDRGELAISAISFWELALLIQKRRLRSLDDPKEQRALMLRAGVIEIPLTGEIAMLAVKIENLHPDSADRFIAATAIAHNATLITADEALLNWKTKLSRQNAEI